MKKSIIYRNVYMYRFVMNILYLFGYRKRFDDITKLLSGSEKNVLELCFGDIFIAKACKNKGINWTGIDINMNFIKFAQKNGFNAQKNDISEMKSLPAADVCIIVGSLYHFHNETETMLMKMLKSAPRILISEPVKNLSAKKGFIGSISKILTNAGKGSENFRYNEESILKVMDDYKRNFNFTYKIISIKKDILIEILHDRN
ncbi:MAG: class I SAM-dependent methyltransferase [Bacteroidales bacterium]|nr:class I SAM-dependent methyltransferase [Bacteroidales bacterium]